jgi:branched-chain amino acid transport system permease protein
MADPSAFVSLAVRAFLSLVNGPQTFGNSRSFWLAAVAILLVALAYPLVGDSYTVGNLAYFGVWLFMALGLSLIWGYGGMLSFGQTAFFGIAGYSYGVIAINLGANYGYPVLALVSAVVIAAAASLVLGYFMIYGRITGVFVGIVTLSVTLIFATFLNQTAGPEWRIGRARLNGYNGMTRIPSLSIPWFDGDKVTFKGPALYYLVLALLVLCYLGLRLLVNSRFGNVLVAIRENPERAELLGYDTRRYQLAAFVIGSTLAGLSGVLYTAWGQFIAPASMALPAAALPIIWVAVGGRKDLTATLIGTLFVLWLFQTLIVISQQYALIVIGALLLVTILYMPGGYIVWLVEHRRPLFGRRRRKTRRRAEGNASMSKGVAE